MTGKRGPRAARPVCLRRRADGENVALVYENGGWHERLFMNLPRTEMIRAVAKANIPLPDGYTRWLEVPVDKMVGIVSTVQGLPPLRTTPGDTEPEPEQTPVPSVVSQETPTPTPTPSGVDKPDSDVLNTLRELLGVGSIDEAQLEQMVDRAVSKVVTRPTVIQLGDQREFTITAPVHQAFEPLLRKIRAGVHIVLTGGPGVGKTTLTGQLAEALGLRHVVTPMKPLPQDHEFFGYNSPITGDLVQGVVRDLYESGGIWVLDELDTAHPSTPPTLNMLLAQDYFDFPRNGGGVERVKRHKDFRVMATGNTYGGGGSVDFAGTTKINEATRDRFTFFHMGIDEKLEQAICDSIDPTFSRAVLGVVRKARANAERYGLRVFITPRASIDATKMMALGDSLRDALNGRLMGRGLPADQEAKLLEGVTFG